MNLSQTQEERKKSLDVVFYVYSSVSSSSPLLSVYQNARADLFMSYSWGPPALILAFVSL